MNAVRLKHPTLEYPDGKIRVLNRDTNVLYRYIDETKKFVIETDRIVIEYIMNGEKSD